MPSNLDTKVKLELKESNFSGLGKCHGSRVAL
jgi:hypothetical protein